MFVHGQEGYMVQEKTKRFQKVNNEVALGKKEIRSKLSVGTCMILEHCNCASLSIS